MLEISILPDIALRHLARRIARRSAAILLEFDYHFR